MYKSRPIPVGRKLFQNLPDVRALLKQTRCVASSLKSPALERKKVSKYVHFYGNP